MTRDDPRPRTWRLLIACARHAARLGDARAVDAAAAEITDWDDAADRAREHGLLPWLARSLTVVGLADGARTTVIDGAGEAAGATLWQVRQLGSLCAALESAGVPVLPYKGPTLSMQLYGDVALRQSVDLDLVVPRDHYPVARRVLIEQGLPSRSGHSERRERTLFDWLGHAPFGEGDRFVELHWRFADRRFPFALSVERALARADRVTIGGHSLPLMSRDDLLVVLAMHGTRHLYERLEWLAGVASLLQAAPGDASRLMAHASMLRARRMLAVSVHMAHRTLGFPIDDGWQRELERDPDAGRLAAVMTDDLAAHELEGRAWLDGAALQQRYAALVDTRFDRARLVAHALFDPTERDQEALPLPDLLMPLHRVLRPVRLAAINAVRLLRPRTVS